MDIGPSEADVLAAKTLPEMQHVKLHSTATPERLNGKSKRRTHVVGNFPRQAAMNRLADAIGLDQSRRGLCSVLAT